MPIIKKLKELFDEAKVGYEVYNYPWAYAARRSLRDNTSLVMRWPRSQRSAIVRCRMKSRGGGAI